MLLKNLSLKIKLVGGFLSISCLVFVVSLISITASNATISLFEDLVHVDFPRLQALLVIENTVSEVTNDTLILASSNDDLATTSGIVEEQKDELLAKVETIHNNIDLYNRLREDESESSQKLEELSTITDDVVDRAFAVLALREQGASRSATASLEEELTAKEISLHDTIDIIIEEELQAIEAEDKFVEKTVDQTQTNVILVSFMTVIIALGAGLLFSFPIVNKVRKLRNAAFVVTQGNLEIRINDNSHDELGQLAQSFDQMTQNLKEVSDQKEKNEEELRKKSTELAQKMAETERINKFMVGREQKMIEMKKEIEALKKT